jgi:hypothetical protein
MNLEPTSDGLHATFSQHKIMLQLQLSKQELQMSLLGKVKLLPNIGI